MKRDKLDRPHIAVYLCGLLLMVWFGLRLAPALSGGLPAIMEGMNTLFQSPFQIKICKTFAIAEHISHIRNIRSVEVFNINAFKVFATTDHTKHIRDIRGVEVREIETGQVAAVIECVAANSGDGIGNANVGQ